MIDIGLVVLFCCIAFLHSAVGLAGGSSYSAVLALSLFPVSVVPGISLALNCSVSTLTSFQYIRARYVDYSILLYLLIGSIPCVFVGSHISLSPIYFYSALFFTLLYSFMTLCWSTFAINIGLNHKKIIFTKIIANYRNGILFFLGALLGFLSGCIGIGGGIYLVPILVIFQICSIKYAAGIGALFIIINSFIGLCVRDNVLSMETLGLIFAVLLGGCVGSYCGSRVFKIFTMQCILLVVMLIAMCLLAIKLYASL